MIAIDHNMARPQNMTMGNLSKSGIKKIRPIQSVFIFLFISISIFCRTELLWAKALAPVTYVSDLDRGFSVESLSIVPLIDNVGKIYSVPLTKTMVDFFDKAHQWRPVLNKVDLETGEGLTPDEVQKITSANSTQALLTARLWKGPRGAQLRLALYLAHDGLPLLIEETNNITEFSIEKLSLVLTQNLVDIYQRFPTQGRILSRRGNEVTINLGTAHGVENGDLINVIQMVSVERHPRNFFMLSHEKTLLGQVKIFKADDYLSFAQISLEKEPGVVQVGSNIRPDLFIEYKLADDGSLSALRKELGGRPESDVSFGEHPEEWTPRPQPQYGRIQIGAGFTQYNQNLALSSAGSLNASTSLGPSLAIDGEAWLNHEWFLQGGLQQSAFAVSNSLPGSTPGELNMTLGQYYLGGGYNFLFENDFWGPKIQMSLGMSQFNARADESSPVFLTNMNYGGLYLGLKGAFPLGVLLPMDLGFQLKYYLTNSLTENISSGSPSGVKITDFGFFGVYKTKKGFNLIGEFNFQYFTSGFSGSSSRADPASSISHKTMSLLAGVEYLF